MSTSRTRLTPPSVRQDAVCMCALGHTCTSFAPGHAVHLIQSRLVSATPSEWVDAIVTSTAADGTIVVHTVTDGTQLTVWNGAGAADTVSPGLPVAFHGRYHVLNVGGRLFNALAL